jgi:hypothetical protein
MVADLETKTNTEKDRADLMEIVDTQEMVGAQEMG